MPAAPDGRDPSARWIALVDDLRLKSGETSWVEFKVNNRDPERIARTLSALANAARLDDKHDAYLIWGVEDKTHTVVGTTFDPSREKRGNQPLELWLASALDPSPNFAFHIIPHPSGRVVVLEVPSALQAPVKYNGIAYLRIGSATPKLSDYPERESALWLRLNAYAWETGVARQFVRPEEVTTLLDLQSYFELLELPEPGNRSDALERLRQDGMIRPDVGGHWSILNLGAILLARDLQEFPGLDCKAVRVIQYKNRSRVTTIKEQTGVRGYASAFERLMLYVDAILPHSEAIEGGRRISVSSYPDVAIREFVANALIHQDMTITGSGPMIEVFSDRVEVTNPGQPLNPPERFIDYPPHSRNEALAAMMRRMSFCEERGSGIDKAVVAVEFDGLPPPDFQAMGSNTRVILYGPRRFSAMTIAERVRACYQHAVLQWLKGQRATNSSFRKRFGDVPPTAAQISRVFSEGKKAGVIKLADDRAPKSGYVPIWA